MEPNSGTMKTVLMLLARRAAAALGVALVTHGVVASGDPNLSGFVEITAGIIVSCSEVALEWWRKTGMVLISAKLANLKGIPMPHQEPAGVVSPAPGAPVVEVKSASA